MEIFDINKLTDEELCGQVLCLDISTFKCDDEKIKRFIDDNKPGGLFIHNMPVEKVKEYAAYANSVCKYPVLVAADTENGPGSVFSDIVELPHPMAWGACDDESLIERAGELTAQIMRRRGVNFTLAPVADINVNPDNPVVNIRAISDSPRTVAKLASAYVRGLQKDGLMAATAKHYPGDGVDDRNQHFCTTVNTLSKEEWDRSFGVVYKSVIDAGVASIMAAHISLPAYEGCSNRYDAPPSIFSKKLMGDLLRGELGFDGCIISDAMSMIGACSVCPLDQIAPRYLAAGGDMVLFPEARDREYLLKALANGELSRERLLDAVRRIIELKKKVRLFENEADVLANTEEGAEEEICTLATEMAERSIKIVRDKNNILPLKNLKKGDKILMINWYLEPKGRREEENTQLKIMEEELRARGFEVDVYHRINHKQIKEILPNYAAVFVNSRISSRDYYEVTLRVGHLDGITVFWRGYLLEHPRLIFVSYGDPYKLYEVPYVKAYVNAFSASESSQRAVVKLVLGEIEHRAKNPVALKDFFDREVD